MDQLTAGTCNEDKSGVASAYVAATHAGYTTQFEAYATSGTNSPLLGSAAWSCWRYSWPPDVADTVAPGTTLRAHLGSHASSTHS